MNLIAKPLDNRGDVGRPSRDILRNLIRVAALVAIALGVALVRLEFDPAAQALFAPPQIGSDEVTFESTKKLNPVWIDARSRAAFERKHIPGARLLTLDKNESFEELLFGIDSDSLLDGSRPVVVYCGSASASSAGKWRPG